MTTPLLDPIWTSGPSTPADEYPTLVEPCDAGMLTVITRTAGWLHQGQVYHLHGSNGNALVLADQLCAETRYQALPCLGGDAAGMAELAVRHEQACALAAVLERAVLVGDPMCSNEVRLDNPYDNGCTGITPQLVPFHRGNLYRIHCIGDSQCIQ
jgi:hypothetical protein